MFIENPTESSAYLSGNEAWLTITPILKDIPILMDGLTDTMQKKIQDLLQKYPQLASWHMFALTDTATGMLQTLMKNTSFKWETCRTQGCKVNSSLTNPPDGPNAWVTAAKNDSTFMVFQCGRYERIGFHHRASQTLYLSGVIDTVNIKDPSYRKLHISLHIAINRSDGNSHTSGSNKFFMSVMYLNLPWYQKKNPNKIWDFTHTMADYSAKGATLRLVWEKPEDSDDDQES
ncbi:hypothetical protein CPB84DRAFT_1930827 [Gymnopilus junonius]|uniref:Uncharacterized protein n=1 Tax=Gymnopilus junonius TaxID=109634 RepID=A0A9P5NM93_GYMJU|nr:hypothetical protein CPB84DRAFT_1930827 [Gymnopilus junonius]